MIQTLIGIFIAISLSSCTFNVSMVHTEGTASDVIDETSSNTPTISPKISATAIPGA